MEYFCYHFLIHMTSHDLGKYYVFNCMFFNMKNVQVFNLFKGLLTVQISGHSWSSQDIIMEVKIKYNEEYIHWNSDILLFSSLI